MTQPSSPSDSSSAPSQPENATPAHEPLFNVPPMTFALTLLLIACFVAWHYTGDHVQEMLVHLVFIPAYFSAEPLHKIYTLFSYALLHFNWAHLIINGTGLLAFGSGIERMMGKRYVLGIFIGGAICGVLGYWALYPHSPVPLIGASAGISALFGALLPLIVKRPQIMMASILFIVVNIVLGLLGLPDDPMQRSSASIAWQAHIAGFLFGEFLTFGIIRFKIAQQKKASRQRNNT